ncbi:MAG: hemolysin XhlA family protein [Eubacterium sp.]
MNEEKIEHIVETHEKRLNDHSERLDDLEKQNATMTERVNNLCEKLETQTKSIDKLTYCILGALASFFFYMIQTLF